MSISFDQVLAADERAANDEIKGRLFGAVRDDSSILFAGSGSSAIIGYPAWEDLINRMVSIALGLDPHFNADPDGSNDLLEIAQRTKDFLSYTTGSEDRYYRFLSDQFSAKRPLHDFHLRISRLPFRGFITTNYDLVIEEALIEIGSEHISCLPILISESDRSQANDYFRCLRLGNGPRRVAHIHGHIMNIPSIVLTSSDYMRVYPDGRQCLLIDFLQAIFALYPVLFIGYSINDKHLQNILERACNIYWRQEHGINYAIMPTTRESRMKDIDKSKVFKEKYGVEIVFYEVLEASDLQQGLIDIIAELAYYCGVDGSDPHNPVDTNIAGTARAILNRRLIQHED